MKNRRQRLPHHPPVCALEGASPAGGSTADDQWSSLRVGRDAGDTSSVIRLAGDRRMPLPPCGTRKTLRACADPRVFRPLRKKRTAFFCHRQRQYAFLLKEKA